MFMQCHEFQTQFATQFSQLDFDVTENAKENFSKILEHLFKNGVTLGCIVSMYVYGALLALKFLKSGLHHNCLLVPDWIDEYVTVCLKPVLVAQDRWQFYEKLFHLV